jgi:electron transfer flavoprotein beta subunit
MRAVVLLSAGLHPVSGRPAPVLVEAQAVRLALALGAEVMGLHAGAEEGSVRDHLGRGLHEIALVPLPAGGDPLPMLVEALHAASPDLVLAGRRGSGGSDSGLLPYRLAHALSWPVAADAAALSRDGNGLAVEQALPRGMRRRVRLGLPCVVTVHPAAPPPLPFAFAAARRGRVARHPGVAAPRFLPEEMEERPYRRRPRLLGAVPGGSAADRLKAATEAASSGGQLLVNPPPGIAAAEILVFLRRVGVLAQR